MNPIEESVSRPVKGKGKSKEVEIEDKYKHYFDGAGTYSESDMALLKHIYDVNGQDAYSAEAHAVGRLHVNEYLALPRGMNIPSVEALDVGDDMVRSNFRVLDLAAVYILNKRRAPDGCDASIYGFLRMEAVKMGWVEAQKEVIYVDAPVDPIPEFITDIRKMSADLQTMREAAFIVPLCAEAVFRTYGHHYLSGLEAEYANRYKTLLQSCLAPEVYALLPPSVLFHHCLHWVSPERARNVLIAQLETSRVPEALVIRANAAPAGTALVTTTAAVLLAMDGSGVTKQIQELGVYDLEAIRECTHAIKSDPIPYHRTSYAYKSRSLTEAEKTKLAKAKEEAIKFAPIAQGFIEALFKDAALGRAKALEKFANQDPIRRNRAARFFRKVARVDADNIVTLITATTVE